MKTLKGHEGIAENNLTASDFFHVIFNIFRVRGDNGAVIVVVGFMKFITLIKKSRVEDKVYFLFDQPGNVAVGKLSRITFRFAGNGFNAQFINFPVGNRREYHPIAQFCKKGEPEGVVFVHI